MKSLKHPDFLSFGSAKDSSENITENHLQYMVAAAYVHYFTTKGFLDENASSFVNAGVGRCSVKNETVKFFSNFSVIEYFQASCSLIRSSTSSNFGYSQQLLYSVTCNDYSNSINSLF